MTRKCKGSQSVCMTSFQDRVYLILCAHISYVYCVCRQTTRRNGTVGRFSGALCSVMAEFLYAYACLRDPRDLRSSNAVSARGNTYGKGLRSVCSMSSIPAATSTIDSKRNERCTARSIEMDDFVTFGIRNVALHTNSSIKMLDLYFEVLIENRIAYTSEIVKNTLFPVWIPFQLSKLEGHGRADRQPNRLTVKKLPSVVHGRRGVALTIVVYRVESGSWQGYYETQSNGKRVSDRSAAFRRDEVLQFRCKLNELVPLAVPLAEIESLPLNTWFFTLGDGGVHVSKRTFRMVRQVSNTSGTTISCLKQTTPSVCSVHVNQSLEHRIRIQTLKRTFSSIHDRVARLSHDIQNGLSLKYARQCIDPIVERHCDAKRDSIQKLRKRIVHLREFVNRLQQTSLQEKKTLDLDVRISKALVKLMHMNLKCKDEQDGILERRYQILRTAYQIRYRQAMLVKALQEVYPIECNRSGECCIRGIRLTNSDLTNNRKGEEECVSTALGYVAHLVFMLSKYFHIQIRYRVFVACSRSSIQDETRDPSLEFPLYRKGVEKDRYERAIQYLGMNVEQVSDFGLFLLR